MTVSIEGARQAEAPGAVIWRVPGGPPQPRPASRRRDAILIVILLAAAARSARLAEAASAQISRVPDDLLPSRPVSRQLVRYLHARWESHRQRCANVGLSVADAPGRTVVA